MTTKKKFLTIYDYGSGGVWTFIYANSAQEITGKYPKLKVLEEEPKWLSEDDKAGIKTCDIDDEPDQFLLKMEKEKGVGDK